MLQQCKQFQKKSSILYIAVTMESYAFIRSGCELQFIRLHSHSEDDYKKQKNSKN